MTGLFLYKQHSPTLEGSHRKLLAAVRVEKLPKGRTKNPFRIEDRETKIIMVDDLMGIFINTHFSPDTLDHNKARQKRLFDHKERTSQSPDCYIHILKTLREHIHRKAEMAMIFEEIYCILRKGLEISIVKFDTRFVYDQLTISDPASTKIMFSVDLIATSNRHITVNIYLPLKTTRRENLIRNKVMPEHTKTGTIKRPMKHQPIRSRNNNGLRIAPPNKPSSESRLTTPWDTKINIDHIRMHRIQPTKK